MAWSGPEYMLLLSIRPAFFTTERGIPTPAAPTAAIQRNDIARGAHAVDEHLVGTVIFRKRPFLSARAAARLQLTK